MQLVEEMRANANASEQTYHAARNKEVNDHTAYCSGTTRERCILGYSPAYGTGARCLRKKIKMFVVFAMRKTFRDALFRRKNEASIICCVNETEPSPDGFNACSSLVRSKSARSIFIWARHSKRYPRVCLLTVDH
jgi:hypothetical protein